MRYICFKKLTKYKKPILLFIVEVFLIFLIGTLILKEVKEDLIFILEQHEENESFGRLFLTTSSYENRDRPGQMGKQVEIPNDLPQDILELIDEENLLHGFHQYKSDLIGRNRILPDYRDEWCKAPNRFLKNLPSTSIIIPVYNEAWSTLTRTINSIVINSPPELIHEIILVIDLSDLAHLKTLLKDHFNFNYLESYKFLLENTGTTYMFPIDTVKLVHTTEREGLIRAKNIGARHATGEVLTFLDAHCECTKGWLEPLLDRIARNSTTVTLPQTSFINNQTFQYHAPYVGAVGFDWVLGFKQMPIPKREVLRRSHRAEPFYSPVMMGGLFSISRAFFEKLGGYDNGLEIWGGENLDISFKVWMCGGCIEGIPCSQVGHIFRSRHFPHDTTSFILTRNANRVAEVWMDEYLEYHNGGVTRLDIGDLSAQKALRKKCKSFDWYLRNVYPELFIPKECPLYGEIRNGMACLDSLGGENIPVALYPCHGLVGYQTWIMTKGGEIRQGNNCLDWTGNGIYIHGCHDMEGNQFWSYSNMTKLLLHPNSQLCLAVGEGRKIPVMMKCDEKDERQLWILTNHDRGKGA